MEVGKDADLAIVIKAPHKYNANALDHNFANWSPYNGLSIDYKVFGTMLRGIWVLDAGFRQFVRP